MIMLVLLTMYVLWMIVGVVQSFLAYGTAYRATKRGGDDGVSLFGWMLLFGVASLVPGLGIYFWYQYREEPGGNKYPAAGVPAGQRVDGRNAGNREEAVPCLLCNEHITESQKYCQHCGGSVADSKEEAAKALRDRVEQGGMGRLIDDDATIKEARMYFRMYGKSACLSYLRRKVKEFGLPDMEITEEEMRVILAQ